MCNCLLRKKNIITSQTNKNIELVASVNSSEINKPKSDSSSNPKVTDIIEINIPKSDSSPNPKVTDIIEINIPKSDLTSNTEVTDIIKIIKNSINLPPLPESSDEDDIM
jgi:hypothetical protein